MAQITINEGLAWLKTVKKRHEELLLLRNDNAHREWRLCNAFPDKEILKETGVRRQGARPARFTDRPRNRLDDWSWQRTASLIVSWL